MKTHRAGDLLLKGTMVVFGQELRSALIKQKLPKANWTGEAILLVLESFEVHKNEINKLCKKNGLFPVAKKYCVSTCFLMAILDVKPMRRLSTGATISFVEKYLNPILAIQAATSILAIFNQSEDQPQPQSNQSKTELFPDGNHANFLEHVIPKLHDASLGSRLNIDPELMLKWMVYLDENFVFPNQTTVLQNEMRSDETMADLLHCLVSKFTLVDMKGPGEI